MLSEAQRIVLKALLSNIIVYAIGTFGGFLYSFLLFRYFYPEAASFYYVFLSYYYLLNFFTVGPIIYTITYYLPKFSSKEAESIIFYASIISATILALITYFAYPISPLTQYIGRIQLAIMNGLMAMFFFFMGSLFLIGHQKKRTLVMLLSFILKISILILAIILNIKSSIAIFYSLVIPYVALCLPLLFMLEKDFDTFRRSIDLYIKNIHAGILLFFENTGRGIASTIDNLILPYIANDKEIAGYNAAFTPARFLLRVSPNVLSSSLLPLLRKDKYIRLWEKGLYYITKYILILFVPATILFIIYALYFMQFYSPAYIDYLWLLQFFLIGLIIVPLNITIRNVLLAAEKLNDALKITVIIMITDFVLNIALGPILGYKGVAIATVISFLLSSLYAIWLTKDIVIKAFLFLLKNLIMFSAIEVMLLIALTYIPLDLGRQFLNASLKIIIGGAVSLITSFFIYILSKEKVEEHLEKVIIKRIKRYLDYINIK